MDRYCENVKIFYEVLVDFFSGKWLNGIYEICLFILLVFIYLEDL